MKLEAEELEECAACHRLVEKGRMVEMPLYYICDDFEECIAAYSGWDIPANESTGAKLAQSPKAENQE